MATLEQTPVGVVQDDGQPFPVFGWIEAGYLEHAVTPRTAVSGLAMVFYRAGDGVADTGRVDDAGAFTSLQNVGPFSTGWTHIVAAGPNLLFYRAGDGVADTGRVDDAGAFTNLQNVGPFGTGWSLIETTQMQTVTPPSVLAPASILQTTYENVPYPPAETDANWAENLTGGSTMTLDPFPPWEWVSVYDPKFEKEGSLNNPMVGLTGWAVDPNLSKADAWFVHPFGFDFEFFIAPDSRYEPLLAASNTGVTPKGEVNDEFSQANASAQRLGLPVPKGVLGLEIEKGLVPPAFQALVTTGTRVAAFGRWIVDAGHDDFHSEIHAPLLMAVATPASPPAGVQGASPMTSLQIISRPYTVSQRFGEGNFANHLDHEVAKLFDFPPESRQVEAHPAVFTTPYDGRQVIELLVQPPVPSSPLQQLVVNFHFTHRAGVAVQLLEAASDTVRILIVLGDLNPARLPPKRDLTVGWDELAPKYAWLIDALQIGALLLNPVGGAFLSRGILTDLYQAPTASSPLDDQNVAGPVGIHQVTGTAGVSEDDTQPFPIYGWLDVWWQEGPAVPLPRIAVQPMALRFGKVPIGVAVQRSFRIDNVGNADLTVTIPGPESGYAWDQGTTTLPPGAGMDVHVTFEPSSTADGGVRSLTVQTNAANGDQVVQLTSSVAGGPPP